MSWQAISSGKEKYQAYLCSREWSEKKEAVRKRSKGVCERCRVNEMNAVHHLTYERKYAERLEDLQAICNQCHDFTHAKSQYDPRVYAPVLVEPGRPIRSVYLAGKITGDGWRGEIVDGWGFQNDDSNRYYAAVNSDSGTRWDSASRAAAAAFGARLDYVGPWWCDFGAGGGHGSASCCGEPHAYTPADFDAHGIQVPASNAERRRAMSAVHKNIDSAITKCDLLFAWINSDDCFGTIFEIGLAVARRKTVVVASPKEFDDHQMWLCQQFAATRIFANTAGEAWKKLWNQVEENV
jgi:hypothetical protein